MIKRPFALAGFSFVYALLALNLVSGSTAVIAAAAGVCLLLCAFAKKLPGRQIYAASMLSVLAACACFQGAEMFVYTPALALEGENERIQAQVTGPVQLSDSGRYTYLLKTADGYRLRLSSKTELNAQACDTVEFTGKVYPMGEQRDEIRTYFKAKNIFLGCTANGEVKVTPCSKRPLGYYVFALRGYIISRLTSLLPGQNGALAAAMVTGDKAALSGEVNSSFSVCGISHILAVSGLHMSIVVFTLYKLLRRLCGRLKRLPSVICIAAALLYAAVAGFTPSASRACVMVCVMFAGKLFSRRSDSLNSLGLAALLLALINPYSVLDLSYMLSFSATLGIVLFSNCLVPERLLCAVKPKAVARLLRMLCEVVAVTLTATVFCLPVYVMFLGSLTLLFLPANLLTFFAVPSVLVFGLLAALTGPVGKAFAFVCGLFCKHILSVTSALSSPGGAALNISGFAFKLWLGCAFLTVAAALLFIKSKVKAYRFCAAFVCLSFAFTAALSVYNGSGGVKVTALDVSSGECFVVQCGSSAALIGCGGDRYEIENALDTLGVKTVELLIIPRGDKTEFAAAKEFMQANPIKTLIIPERSTLKNFAKSYVITQSYSCNFHGVSIAYKRGAGSAVCRISALACNLLVTFSADTPPAMLGKADFLLSRAQPPACLDTGSFEAVLVESTAGTVVNSQNVYSTRDNGMLTLTVNRSGSYEIERY